MVIIPFKRTTSHMYTDRKILVPYRSSLVSIKGSPDDLVAFLMAAIFASGKTLGCNGSGRSGGYIGVSREPSGGTLIGGAVGFAIPSSKYGFGYCCSDTSVGGGEYGFGYLRGGHTVTGLVGGVLMGGGVERCCLVGEPSRLG